MKNQLNSQKVQMPLYGLIGVITCLLKTSHSDSVYSKTWVASKFHALDLEG